MAANPEQQRLAEHTARLANWKQWGPYLSDRAWGTVREDYSSDGNAWDHFPHDHARSRAYRWGEDGLAGICDRHQYLCFALSLYNGADPIIKERLFGLNNREGNHGEDVKEYYFHLDNTPTHSYMKLLYKYPHAPFPYSALVRENGRRGADADEFELCDTGVFDENRYFDVFVEYAKADPKDMLIRITLCNRGPKPAECHLLPTLWFRNTWSWEYPDGPMGDVPGKPVLEEITAPKGIAGVKTSHPAGGNYFLYAQNAPQMLFTENETNQQRLSGGQNGSFYVKDAFDQYIVHGETEAVNPGRKGTKCAAVYHCRLNAGGSQRFILRLTHEKLDAPFSDAGDVLEKRRAEADEFYQSVGQKKHFPDEAAVFRQALAGMLWNKQFYYYNVSQWLAGDTGLQRDLPDDAEVRNAAWTHLENFDILSMPDKWEYPWFASWDLAFHCIVLGMVDPAFAKRQLILLTREWYMHPNGQIPAYEWQFGDVNPPVHAWSAMQVYQQEKEQAGKADTAFLEGIFHKLLLNFTWWVNKKDEAGKNIFQGGFLGLDNISLFDRSRPLPSGGHLDQSDATAWMGFYCLNMITMALELAKTNPVYQDTASKFFEHFMQIARAMTGEFRHGVSLWDETDGFFYDAIHIGESQVIPLKVRSLVGLIPLMAVEVLDAQLLDRMPDFKRRMLWFFDNRSYLRDQGHMACVRKPGIGERRIFSVVNEDRLRRMLAYMLDENEFLSPYGIRSLSRVYKNHPYHLQAGGQTYEIDYQPAQSAGGDFGGNSNWRGPVWFPVNYLIISALEKYHLYYGDEFTIAFPTGSGRMRTLKQVADELSERLIRLFLPDPSGSRPAMGHSRIPWQDPHWRELLLFPEYFNGDNGSGLGASHQTGWTGLVANLIRRKNNL